MTSTIQVCIDCANAHDQADWWAETLGWVLEPTDQDFIDSLLQQGYATPEQLMEHGLKGRGSHLPSG
ncbi:hypothetical protein OL239_03785 [Arthrobacter sp. ATA002]|uniref:VOC family protein n=1 Tax=Arthrobacter sp. ATA002 TaxID=2991715 RepID=UPI0022A765C8|nr:VOC family protein [Arthrobacter sp. ATA002]WAP52409.1 hypothetical protein OL239_03785 [Arthrobacter sp. ATA002]